MSDLKQPLTSREYPYEDRAVLLDGGFVAELDHDKADRAEAARLAYTCSAGHSGEWSGRRVLHLSRGTIQEVLSA